MVHDRHDAEVTWSGFSATTQAKIVKCHPCF